MPGKVDTYIGIYILNYKIIVNDTDYQIPYMTCPEQVYGVVSIEGEYHLFTFEDGKISSDIAVPISKTEFGENTTSTANTFVLKNSKQNRFYIFGGVAPEEEEKDEIVRIDLINFNDYTGDKINREFNLVGYYISCGHVERLIAGYNNTTGKVIIYPIVEGSEISYWHDNFIPKDGAVDYWVLCGDHASEIEIHDYYRFDFEDNEFKLINSTENSCFEDDNGSVF